MAQRQIADAQTARAETERARAERSAANARAGELVAQVQLLLGQEIYDPSLAHLLAGEAVQTTLAPYGDVLPETERALQDVIWRAQAIGWRMTLPRAYHSGEVYSAVFSPDGRTILTAGDDSVGVNFKVEECLMLSREVAAVVHVKRGDAALGGLIRAIPAVNISSMCVTVENCRDVVTS